MIAVHLAEIAFVRCVVENLASNSNSETFVVIISVAALVATDLAIDWVYFFSA